MVGCMRRTQTFARVVTLGVCFGGIAWRFVSVYIRNLVLLQLADY